VKETQLPMLTLSDEARKYSDKEWFELLLASVDAPTVAGITFPGFPAEAIQTMFVGSANRTTLTEAFQFYQFLKKAASKARAPLRPQSRFLDFGCGWGRYLRFFWKDVSEGNLYGCDTDGMIIDLCKTLNVPGHLAHIDPFGALPWPTAHFDAAMAYSVFTHLPESAHQHWMKELARVMRPGGVFCLTLEPRRFLDFIANLAEPDNEWYRMLMMHKPRLPEYYRSFDAGGLVFMPTNPGVEERYGDAVVPLSYIKKQWAPYFKVIDYVDKPQQFWQAVLVVQRTKTPYLADRS
jgi:SAM-dependent methyltransferase